MPICKATVEIPRDTGLAEDTSVNTFHFDTAGSLDTAFATEVVRRLTAFYNDEIPGMVNAVTAYLSPINNENARINLYDVAAPKDTPPFATAGFILGGFGPAPYPEEVALVVGFKATPVAGVPPARLRGRIYLGPLATNAGEVVGGRVRPTNTACTDVIYATDHLAELNGTDIRWGHYSAGKGTYDATKNPDGTQDWTPFFATAVTAWCDNDFDTQRRRGPAATARFSTVVPIP